MKKAILLALALVFVLSSVARAASLKCEEGQRRTAKIFLSTTVAMIENFRKRGALITYETAGIGEGGRHYSCSAQLDGSGTVAPNNLIGRTFTMVSVDEERVTKGLKRGDYLFQIAGTENYLTIKCGPGSNKHPLREADMKYAIRSMGIELSECVQVSAAQLGQDMMSEEALR